MKVSMSVRLPRLLCVCLLAGVLALVVPAAGGGGSAGAEEYSAYSDPGKTAISVILSEEENVRELQAEFDLDGGEVERALAAVREENKKVAEEFAESEEIVSANRSLSDGKVAGKIAASDYDETISSAIGETKSDLKALLPDGSELRGWVDEQWRQEVAEASEGVSGRVIATKAGSRKSQRSLLCDKIFATQYIGYTRFEAALPHRGLKFGARPEVPIVRGKRSIRPRVKEVGPWNTYDNYWRMGRDRTMWKGLRRCVPQARAAYFNNYNRGRDEFGRKVLNPGGVDLTPTAARRLGLDKYQNAYVSVRFPWVRR